MKKKIMAVTLCLAMVSTFAVGCGQKNETDSGKSEEKIENCAHRHGCMDTVRKDTFEEAIQYCYDNAKSGDAVLLSPACASWGMFPNYEERGRIFKEYVRNLEE